MSAEDSAHGDLHSSSSHLLGECLMELLLLPREDLGYCDKFLKSKVNLDVSHLQSLIEQLKPDSFLTEERKKFHFVYLCVYCTILPIPPSPLRPLKPYYYVAVTKTDLL